MGLPCPQCGAALREVAADAVTGYRVVVDQCPACGGIWADRWELFPLTAEAVARLDPPDAARAAPLPPAPALLPCPRCRVPMPPFRDPVIPQDARIERCPNCEGMWFNRGELRRARPRARSRTDAASVDRLAGTVSGSDPPPTIRCLDEAVHGAPPPDAEGAPWAAHAAWIIGRILLRLLLRV